MGTEGGCAIALMDVSPAEMEPQAGIVALVGFFAEHEVQGFAGGAAGCVMHGGSAIGFGEQLLMLVANGILFEQRNDPNIFNGLDICGIEVDIGEQLSIIGNIFSGIDQDVLQAGELEGVFLLQGQILIMNQLFQLGLKRIPKAPAIDLACIEGGEPFLDKYRQVMINRSNSRVVI